MPPYGRSTTATQLAADLTAQIANKTILITGPSPSSIGSAFAQAVASANPALLILAGRSPSKLAATATSVTASHPTIQIRTLPLDLSSLSSVREAAATVNSWSDVPKIDVLLNNAGIMATEYSLTEDGIESQFATNHVAHWLFTNLIMGKIIEAKGRVVNVASDGHRLERVRFEDVGFDEGRTYDKWRAYGQSKTANMLMPLGLAERVGKLGVRAYSVHPGVIMTGLADHLDLEKDVLKDLKALDQALGNKEGWAEFEFKSLDQGAATSVYAAFHSDLEDHNGAYLQDCRIADPWTDTVRPWATSPIEAEKLWKLSEKLVGQGFSY
ncbi:hypothetical protein OQA88_6084 [Cercophora sp. LCS_1]